MNSRFLLFLSPMILIITIISLQRFSLTICSDREGNWDSKIDCGWLYEFWRIEKMDVLVPLVPLVVVRDGVIFLCERTCVSGAAAEFLLCRRTAYLKMVSQHVTWRNIRKPFWLMITIVLQFFKAIQSGRSCINSTLKSQLSNKTGYCFAPAHLHFNWMKITDRGALWRHGSRQKLGRQEAQAAGEGEWAEGRQWKTHIVHPRTHS